MATETAMQLYLDQEICTECLINDLNTLLGMRIETLGLLDEQATAFLMITRYKKGFATGINVSWRADLMPKNDRLEVAKTLATRYQTLVATDLPLGDPFASNPFYWYVANPDGTLAITTQDTSNMDSEVGLVLNGHLSNYYSFDTANRPKLRDVYANHKANVQTHASQMVAV